PYNICIQTRSRRKQTKEKPAMPVGPVHNGFDTKAPARAIVGIPRRLKHLRVFKCSRHFPCSPKDFRMYPRIERNCIKGVPIAQPPARASLVQAQSTQSGPYEQSFDAAVLNPILRGTALDFG